MKQNRIVIIEIGSNNTKTHVYDANNVIYENTTTIEFKKNYGLEKKIVESDLEKLYHVIDKAITYSSNIYVFGCSIFRNLNEEELESINHELKVRYGLEIEVVTQEEEAQYTALGCYSNLDYEGELCIFIGGGGSIELLFVNNHEIVDTKYFDFGVVDVTKKFVSLKDDIPSVSFDEVYQYVANLVGDIERDAKVLILAGGDHFYWYDNAGYKLLLNNLYHHEHQPYMITREMSDEYDYDAFIISLEKIRNRSDNPKWFDGSRAMKAITNLISHKVNAQYIIPTKINMEDGLKIEKEKELASK